MAEYQLHGFKELEQALLALGDKPAKRYGRKALRAAGKPLLEGYKAGTKVLTGHLMESETMGTRLNKRQRRLNRKEGPSDVELHIGTVDPAGLMEEFGIHQAAVPALTQAWDAEGGETAIERIGASLGADIEKAARRGGKGPPPEPAEG